MKPYNREYVLRKIGEFNKKISNFKSGDFEIRIIDGLDGIIQGYMYSKEDKIDISILELHGPEHCWMRLTPLEVEASYFPIKMAKGKVGVVGLGLGYTVQEMAKKESVEEIIVYEVSKDVINLYLSNFGENEKIKILNVDAFEAKGEEFDFFYVDIYQYKITAQIPKDFEKINKLHKVEEYSFFGMEHFLLSCNYEEIVWVYVPENWMDTSRKAFEKLQESGLLDYYEPLNEKLVSQVLQEFKIILDEM